MPNFSPEETNKNTIDLPLQVLSADPSVHELMKGIEEGMARLHTTNVAATESFWGDAQELQKELDEKYKDLKADIIDPKKYESRIKGKLFSYRVVLLAILINIIKEDSHLNEDISKTLDRINKAYNNELIFDLKYQLAHLGQFVSKGITAEPHVEAGDKNIRQFLYGCLALQTITVRWRFR